MKYKLKNKYVVGVLLAVLVLTINQLFIQFWLNKKHESTKNIHLSVQQIVLSQQLNLEFIKLLNQELSQKDLEKTFKDWQTIHFSLLNGDKSLGVNAVQNLDARLGLLTSNRNVALIKHYLKPNFKIDLKRIQAISENQASFLVKMNQVIKILEEEQDKDQQFVIMMEILLAILSVFIIAAEVIYVFQPIEKELLKTIDELESSESKLLAILDSSTDSNIFISPDLKIVNFNKSAQEDVLKYHNKQLTVGDDFRPFIASSTKEAFYAFFNEALNGKITVKETEVIANGQSVWFKIRFFPVYDSHSKIIGVTFNATSIDEVKKAELKSNEQVALLKRIAWEQSHLVRNPLSNILGFTKIILDKDYQITEEERNAFIEQLGEEAQKLDKVVKEIVREAYYVYNK
ncbi:PAS domain S-box protein [Arcicella rosea]|uniref:histidine kinase n=1 Tax=Arcicella rosea TaxID=502909 RepID=A0A841EQY7_9BACT|nr:PAS domain S-box protein [Arcicella rosea]MBB6003433.1 PAS domain S-box-containing protein [Arcicella rosea]